jgi:subtilisin family serine protease
VKHHALALLAACLVGCAAPPTLTREATLPVAARTQPAGYLVLTVRNELQSAPLAAASTPRGYAGLGHYAASGTALAQGRALAREYGLLEVASWPIATLGVHCLVYGLPAGADAARLQAALGRDRRVESVQPLQSFATEGEGYNDPYAKLQQNVTTLAIPAAQAAGRGGSGVSVALIDTGADVGHPDLRPRAASIRNFVNADAAEFRSDAHGTAVMGVIGAVPNNGLGMVGVAPGVGLTVYKACWRALAGATGSVCNTFTLAQALAAAIDAHADIINLSLGGPSDPLLTRLVQQGQAGGAIVVGAMPRDGLRRGFPVDIQDVIAVDVAEAGRSLPGVIHAPGRDILSLAPDGHYDFYSGSSLATAEVTGIIALLRSARPGLSARDAQKLLSDSAAGGTAVPDACQALAQLVRGTTCVPPGGVAAGTGSAGGG